MVTIVDFLAQAVKDKPTDGSDCLTLEQCRKELGRLRRVTGKVVKVLSNAKELAAATGGGGAVAPAPGNEVKKRTKSLRHRNALTIDQSFKEYTKINVDKSSEDRALIRSAIKTNALFTDFSSRELEEFIDVFASKQVKAGVKIIKQGDEGDSFYVVQSGSLDIFIKMGEGKNMVETQVGVPYVRGGSFGELALLYDSPRSATIKASEDSILWEISRKAFKGLQMQMAQKAHDLKLKQIRNVKIGDKLLERVMTPEQIESMAMASHYQHFDDGVTIVKEGEKGNIFYMITSGEVDIYKKSAGSKKIATLGPNSFFGEKALTGADTRQATCVAAKATNCLTLARDDFNLMLGNLEDVLAGRRMSLRESNTGLNNSFFERKSKNEKILQLKDLKIKRVLGQGAFGKVNLVKSREDGKLYALKAQAKANIVENSFQEKLITEYRMMRELVHPFLVECVQAIQDKKYIYFLMGLLPGGEILDLLEKYDKLPPDWVRFYGGTVVMVFEYMHQQKIAYRDLKPENLVLDEAGYCHVVDLGLAKRCNTGKTWTTCGTPDYLAPEIITGKGHDWGVDYWALGVLLFELTDGFPPFYDDNPTITAKKVIKGTYSIPPNFDRKLVDLICKLLTIQSKRLGRTQGGVRNIRKHPWFGKFNWQALLDRKMPPPYVPELGNLEKLGSKDDGKWDAPDSDWEADLTGTRRDSWKLALNGVVAARGFQRADSKMRSQQ